MLTILRISSISMLLESGAYLFRTSLRNFDGRVPFGRRNRRRPFGAQTVQNALDAPCQTPLEDWNRKNIHTWENPHRREISPISAIRCRSVEFSEIATGQEKLLSLQPIPRGSS